MNAPLVIQLQKQQSRAAYTLQETTLRLTHNDCIAYILHIKEAFLFYSSFQLHAVYNVFPITLYIKQIQ